MVVRLKFVVLVKAVPDPKSTAIRVRDERIDMQDVNMVINEQDSYALEEAVRLKEAKGGSVTVISLGDEQRKKAMMQMVKECYAKGADDGILVLDNQYDGWDTAARARVLAAAVAVQKADMVLAGSQSYDGASSRMGPMLAHFLDIPHVTLVTSLSVTDNMKVHVTRDLEQGTQELVETGLPCVITTQTGINTPRYAALSKIIAASRKEIKMMSLQDLQLEGGELDTLNRIVIERFHLPAEQESNAVFIEGTPEEKASKLLQLLKERGIL